MFCPKPGTNSDTAASKTPTSDQHIGHVGQGHRSAVRLNHVEDAKRGNPHFNAKGIVPPGEFWIMSVLHQLARPRARWYQLR